MHGHKLSVSGKITADGGTVTAEATAALFELTAANVAQVFPAGRTRMDDVAMVAIRIG